MVQLDEMQVYIGMGSLLILSLGIFAYNKARNSNGKNDLILKGTNPVKWCHVQMDRSTAKFPHLVKMGSFYLATALLFMFLSLDWFFAFKVIGGQTGMIAGIMMFAIDSMSPYSLLDTFFEKGRGSIQGLFIKVLFGGILVATSILTTIYIIDKSSPALSDFTKSVNRIQEGKSKKMVNDKISLNEEIESLKSEKAILINTKKQELSSAQKEAGRKTRKFPNGLCGKRCKNHQANAASAQDKITSIKKEISEKDEKINALDERLSSLAQSGQLGTGKGLSSSSMKTLLIIALVIMTLLWISISYDLHAKISSEVKRKWTEIKDDNEITSKDIASFKKGMSDEVYSLLYHSESKAKEVDNGYIKLNAGESGSQLYQDIRDIFNNYMKPSKGGFMKADDIYRLYKDEKETGVPVPYVGKGVFVQALDSMAKARSTMRLEVAENVMVISGWTLKDQQADESGSGNNAQE